MVHTRYVRCIVRVVIDDHIVCNSIVFAGVVRGVVRHVSFGNARTRIARANATRRRILRASVVRGRYRVYPSSVRNAAIASASAVSCARLGRGEGRGVPGGASDAAGEFESSRRLVRVRHLVHDRARSVCPRRYQYRRRVRHLVHDRARSVSPRRYRRRVLSPPAPFGRPRHARHRLGSLYFFFFRNSRSPAETMYEPPHAAHVNASRDAGGNGSDQSDDARDPR